MFLIKALAEDGKAARHHWASSRARLKVSQSHITAMRFPVCSGRYPGSRYPRMIFQASLTDTKMLGCILWERGRVVSKRVHGASWVCSWALTVFATIWSVFFTVKTFSALVSIAERLRRQSHQRSSTWSAGGKKFTLMKRLHNSKRKDKLPPILNGLTVFSLQLSS